MATFPWLRFPGSTAHPRLLALPPADSASQRYGVLIELGPAPPPALAEALAARGFRAAVRGNPTVVRSVIRTSLSDAVAALRRLPGAEAVEMEPELMRRSENLIDMRRPDRTPRPPGRDPRVRWFAFPNTTAHPRRMVLPRAPGEEPQSGIAIDLGDAPPPGLRAAAVAAGFSVADDGSLRVTFLRNEAPAWLAAVRTLPGAVATDVPSADMRRREHSLDLRPPRPRRAPPAPVPDTGPALARVEDLGKNFAGDLVVRDGPDRFILRRADEAGQFLPETPDALPAAFLRARSPEDVPGLAEGLWVEMQAGGAQLSAARLDRLAALAVEPGGPDRGASTGALPADAMEAFGRAIAPALADELRRRVVTSIETDAPPAERRDQLRAALVMADRLSRGVTAYDNGGLTAAPQVPVLMRHALGQAEQVEVTGSIVLARALTGAPDGQREQPDAQVIDLTAAPARDQGARVAAAPARRRARGTSLLLLRGRPEEPEVEAVRHDLGLAYGIEAVGEISPSQASGDPEQPPVTLLAFGERRPVAQDMLPDAALRTYRANSLDGLEALAAEIQRARGRIREWNRGDEADDVEAIEGTESYVGYTAISKAGQPFARVPRSLEGALTRAQERVARRCGEEGGVDTAMSHALGLTREQLGARLTPEQVDAVALAADAAARGRGMLIADATGIGKGRIMQAIARQHLLAGGRVLSLTERPVNIPDVFRDLGAVGLPAGRTAAVMARAKRVTWQNADEAGETHEMSLLPMDTEQRRALLAAAVRGEDAWPEGVDYLCTTYSMVSATVTLDDGEQPAGRDTPQQVWAREIAEQCRRDGRPLLVLADEVHNCLTPNSRAGRFMRLLNREADRVVMASATWLRDTRGMDLYEPLMPPEQHDDNALLRAVALGGAAAQECLTTMLTEDGVLLRREHDLSALEFYVDVPPDDEIAEAELVMQQAGEIAYLMVQAHARIKAVDSPARVQLGLNPAPGPGAAAQRDRWEANLGTIGSPLARLNTVVLNALRAPMVARNVVRELQEGRKPLIAFQATNQGVLQAAHDERVADAGAAPPDDAVMPLTASRSVARINDSLYRIRDRDGVAHDARHLDPVLAQISRETEALIAALPESLPMSPLDLIREGIEAAGFSYGEVSGRDYEMRDGEVHRRVKPDRQELISRFNNGEVDVLAYNAAGATGTSYHAAPDVADQRRRVFIEFEAPPDIIKYVQSIGRGNRYGQTSAPRMVSIVAGLAPEMRLVQQRNRKLRAMGAAVDANRAHPHLARNVPDLLNQVGDAATALVLRQSPDVARRMGMADEVAGGLPGMVDLPGHGRGAAVLDAGGVVGTVTTNYANKALMRLMLLAPDEQREIMGRITQEFETLVAELDRRNMNPLVIRRVSGRFEPAARTVFSGVEPRDDDGGTDRSQLSSPVYLETGMQISQGNAVQPERVLEQVERARVVLPGGLRHHADQLRLHMPTILTDATGIDAAAVLAEGGELPPAYVHRTERLERLAGLLENLRPGVEIVCEADGETPAVHGIVTGLTAPPRLAPTTLAAPASYGINIMEPGAERAHRYSLANIMRHEQVTIRPGFADGPSEDVSDWYRARALESQRVPQQFLTGNLIQALVIARRHGLGAVTAVADDQGQLRRGIAVPTHKVELGKLPVPVPNFVAAACALVIEARGQQRPVHIYEGPDRLAAEITLSLGGRRARRIRVTLPGHWQRRNQGFWRTRRRLDAHRRELEQSEFHTGQLHTLWQVTFPIDAPGLEAFGRFAETLAASDLLDEDLLASAPLREAVQEGIEVQRALADAGDGWSLERFDAVVHRLDVAGDRPDAQDAPAADQPEETDLAIGAADAALDAIDDEAILDVA
ncbi:MAG: strawberry notch C-terminal domain-containing protein [Alphaproteobacteria bacterium]|nr:strawberry notch C-terminal domain-containing protein [Alphaproteobacteria bacterium]